MFTRYALAISVMLATALLTTPGHASWDEALRQLRSEKSKAEQCLRASQKLDATVQKEASAKYEKTKELLNSVYTDLQRLFTNEETVKLARLERNFSAAVQERIALCKSVPQQMQEGQRNVMLNIVQNTIKPGLSAIKTLFGLKSADKFKLRTLKTGLEAAKLESASDVIQPE